VFTRRAAAPSQRVCGFFPFISDFGLREAIAEVTAENAKTTKRKEMACFFVFFELFAVIQEFCNRLSDLGFPAPPGLASLR
jgi:hypothetical protein